MPEIWTAPRRFRARKGVGQRSKSPLTCPTLLTLVIGRRLTLLAYILKSRNFGRYRRLRCRVFLGCEPTIRLLFCFLFSHPILLLKAANEPVAGSFNVIKVIIGKLAPLLLHRTPNLMPLRDNLIPQLMVMARPPYVESSDSYAADDLPNLSAKYRSHRYKTSRVPAGRMAAALDRNPNKALLNGY